MPIGRYTDTLKHPGLQPFLWTQFLGALNDNIYKIVVSLLAVNLAISAGGGSGYLIFHCHYRWSQAKAGSYFRRR